MLHRQQSICYGGYKSQLKNELVSVVCLTHYLVRVGISLVSELSDS